MSVNNTVRRARCDCAGAPWLPVSNCSISVAILSGSVNQGAWSAPSSSTMRAPGMWSARYRPDCTGAAGSLRAWRTSVGTVIVGRIGLTSIRNDASSVTRAIPGLAHMRSNIPSWRIGRTDEMTHLSASPLPHADRTARPNSCQRAIHATDGAYSSPSSRTTRARSSAGSHSRSSQPSAREYDAAPVRINARVRSGRVAAKRTAAGPPSLTPRTAAFPKPAASMTASISAARSSSVRNFGTGSDSPTPALSNKRTRANVPSFSIRDPNSGMVQYSSTWLVYDPAQTSSTGPSPNT